MAKSGFQVRGLTEMKNRILQMEKSLPRRLEAALKAEAEIEMTEAKRRTPVDTGTLRNSGRVSDPTWSGEQLSVHLSFGGAASHYALIVHEDLNAFHAVGQAKFLESTLMESAPFMAKRIAERIKF